MVEDRAYYSGMATDKAKLMVYVDQAYKDGLGKLAALENRSMSNYVETLIIDAVDRAVAEGKIQVAEIQQPKHS
jgi:hypothetical protein